MNNDQPVIGLQNEQRVTVTSCKQLLQKIKFK